MSLQSVRAFLAEHAPDIEILEATTSTATVALAAAAHGVQPAEIAKTLSLRLNGDAILLVMSGEARLDNRKYKDRFGAKAKMLDAAEVLAAMRRLDERQRAIVFFTYWQDRSPVEIADDLGVNVRTVQRELAAARQQLLEELR